MVKVKKKRMGKVIKRKLYARIAAGDRTGVIAKALHLPVPLVSYHRSRYNKGLAVIPKVKKRRSKFSNLKVEKVSLPNDPLIMGTSQEKVEALIRYLGKEALKTLLED